MYSFQEAIKEQLREEQAEWKPQTEFWRASDTGKCLRMRYMKRKGVPFTKPFDDRTLRVFRAGDIFHWWLQQLAKQKDCLEAKEAEVWSDKMNVVGHFDALINPGNGDGLILYDFKSKHSYGFKYLAQDGAQEDHKKQVSLYRCLIEQNGYAVMEEIDGEWCSVEYPPVKIDSARVLYISKDDLRILEFDAEYDIKELAEEYKKLNNYFARNELPPCTCKEQYNGNGHKYCTYNTGKDSCCDEALMNNLKEV